MAKDVFTGRAELAEQVWLSVADHFTLFRNGAIGIERRDRSNIVSLYGVSGIGKSTFSDRFERWATGGSQVFDWRAQSTLTRQAIATRIDFENGQFTSLDTLLRLRATLGSVVNSVPSFDLALRLWWERHKGDVPLPELPVRKNSYSEAVKETIGTEIWASAGDILGDLLPSSAARAGAKLLDRIRERVSIQTRSRQAHLNPKLVEVLSSGILETSAQVPPVLATLMHWDYLAIPNESRPDWLVFIDTFEELNRHTDRQQESKFQEIVWQLPELFWIVTGRMPLEWNEQRLFGLLPHCGPEAWPKLVDAGMKIRVRDLVEDEAVTVLRRSLIDTPQPDEVLDSAARASAGVPQHLILCADWIGSLSAGGRVVSPEDVAITFEATVQNLVRDLPLEERKALMGACVLRHFDVELLAEIASCEVGAIERLCRRSIIEHDRDRLLPFQVHSLTRSSTLSHAVRIEGGWADTDWRNARSRAMEALRLRHQNDLDPERRTVYFALAVQLAFEMGGEHSWLLRAAVALPTMASAALAVPARPDGVRTWTSDLVDYLYCWRPSSDGVPRHERLQDFLSDRRDLSPAIRHSAMRFQAYSFRASGKPLRALQIFRTLEKEGLDAQLYRYQQGLTLLRVNEFAEVAKLIVDLRMASKDSPSDTHGDALEGGLLQWHGRILEAKAGAEKRDAALTALGRHREALENRADAVLRGCILGTDFLHEAEELADVAERRAQFDVYRTARASAALAVAGTAQFGEALELLAGSFRLGEVGALSRDYRRLLPVVMDAFLRKDRNTVLSAQSNFNKGVKWVRIVDFWKSGVFGDAL